MTSSRHPARTTTLHRLRRQQTLTLRRPSGLCVRAERGWLWLTVDGDPTDIELAPGDSRILEGRANVIVSPLCGDAVASVTRSKAPAPAWALRLQDWLRASAQAASA